MSFPRIVVLGSMTLFSLIGFLGIVKKLATKGSRSIPVVENLEVSSTSAQERSLSSPVVVNGDFPQVDRVDRLFNVKESLLPIVETIVYTSSVPWLKGRLAWISDYASHYSTSRHFIARSLKGKSDYCAPTVFEGNKFNVFCLNKKLQFYLVVDLSRCKMGLYYYDVEKDERVLLKTYLVGLGKPLKEALSTTPEGKFSIGDNVGIYNREIIGYHLDKKVQLIQVFGTRWLPFEGSGAKSIGIQGAPWVHDTKTGELIEDLSSIGKYESDGCIRMAQEDVEELYAIVITKPTFIEVVKDLCMAQLPGKEVDLLRDCETIK